MPHNFMASRRRPLQVCRIATLTIVSNLYKRAVDHNAPLGSLTPRLAELGSQALSHRLLVYTVLYPWLVLLVIADDLILSTEKLLETYFPQCPHIFDKIDRIVAKVEDLPIHFEYVMCEFPDVLYKIPLLKLLFIGVIVRGVDNEMEEKEIGVDTNCNSEQLKKNDALSQGVSDTTRPNGVPSESNEGRPVVPGAPVLKCSYKEVLEKGVKAKEEKKNSELAGKGEEEDGAKDKSNEEKENWDDDKETEVTKKKVNRDPVLDLFDFGWGTPKTRSPLMFRSASYT